MSTSPIGIELPEGEAKILNDRFNELKSTLPEDVQQMIPNVVCYSLPALQNYLGILQLMFEEKGIPEDEQGVAIMFGKYSEDFEKEHLRNKVTAMFLVSRIEGDETGRITKLDNCIIKEGTFEPPAEIGDVSFDLGSLNP